MEVDAMLFSCPMDTIDVVPLGKTHQFDSDDNVSTSADASGSGSGSDDNNSTQRRTTSSLNGDETSVNATDTSFSLMDNSQTLSKSRKDKSNSSQGKKYKMASDCSNTSCDSSDSSSGSASSNYTAELSDCGSTMPVNHSNSSQYEALPNDAAIAVYYSQFMQFSHNVGGMGIHPGLYLYPQASNDTKSIANNQMRYNSTGAMHMPMNYYYLNTVNCTPSNNIVKSVENNIENVVRGSSQSSSILGTENVEVFAIPWNEVITLFEGEFDSIFGTCSCKAHLDVSEVLVDGAKGRWKHVLLLDTIVAFAFGLEKARPDSERRRFNQYSTLRESVINIFNKHWVEFVTKQQSYLVGKLKETTDQSEIFKIYKMIQNLAVLPKKIMVTGVSFPWHDSSVLKNHLLAQSTAKSWKKREESVTLLIDKLQQYRGTLIELYSEVVNKLYYQHLCIPIGFSGSTSTTNMPISSSSCNNGKIAGTADVTQNNKALLELLAAVESVVADDMKFNGKKRKNSK